MSLISYGSGWRQKERASDHGKDEGKTEEGERMAHEVATIPSGYGTLVPSSAKRLGGESGRHGRHAGHTRGKLRGGEALEGSEARGLQNTCIMMIRLASQGFAYCSNARRLRLRKY